MAIIKCKMCGGDIALSSDKTFGTCDFCGSTMTFPRADDEHRLNLFNRANHFRRQNEFDKAVAAYERILDGDNTDAEAHWGVVLSRFGIEYVEDPVSHERIPTCHRVQTDSILSDGDYLAALEYAPDGYSRDLYEAEAKRIAEIQRGILAISAQEKPYDVFICYKETDADGARTRDSALAQEIYYQLQQEGFKVFFSRITLEDKLGRQYEPYIFAALNSAKVMLAVGTRPEYFNAVWVKNEWSRYLSLMKQDRSRLLIPCYRDMDAYDLPDELSSLQSQDMGKIGFMQDLIRGVKKVLSAAKPQQAAPAAAPAPTSAISPLLRRAFMFLEDGDWAAADEYCEKVLDMEPENAEAYLGKLMAAHQINKREALKDCEYPFDQDANYLKALRFGDEKLKAELTGCINYINTRNENARLDGLYQKAMKEMRGARFDKEYRAAAQSFVALGDYKDAAEKAAECREKAEITRKNDIYRDACQKMAIVNMQGPQAQAMRLFESIKGWRDADEKSALCQKRILELQEQERLATLRAEKQAARKRRQRKILLAIAAAVILIIVLLTTVIIPNGKYNAAITLMNQGKYSQAIAAFEALGNHKDSKQKISECSYQSALALQKNGDKIGAAIAYGTAGNYREAAERSAALWNEIAQRDALSAGSNHTVGLKKNGTAVAVGSNSDKRCNVSGWKDIIAVSAGIDHTVGLKKDGTVLAVGNNKYDQCNVSGWKDIVAVSAGYYYTVGLKKDGTVVAVGSNDYDQCSVSGWQDIIAVSAGYYHTVGLKKDGTVVTVGSNTYSQRNVSGWQDIIAVSAGYHHTVGLKKDGTVVAVGRNNYSQCDVSGWKDIIAVSAGYYHTVGLKKDGTVVAVGQNSGNQCNVSGWNLLN